MSPEASAALVLYDYWRSSAAYRVRVALHLKGLAFEQRAVNLVRDGGEQHGPEYRRLNPQGLVPALIHDGRVLTQSLAICEYLDETFPASPLLPRTAAGRARVRAMALLVACEIHPLNNLRVQHALRDRFGADGAALQSWMNHWMTAGFAALERQVAESGADGPYCDGERPGLADCFLVPQFYNAERYACELGPFPRLRAIVAACRALPAFAAAAPEAQPDAVST